MPPAILVGMDHGENLDGAWLVLRMEGYIPNMPEKNCFNHRRHRLADPFPALFSLLGEI